MVDKFKEILSKIKADKGEVYLFGLLKMDELLEKWTVLLSAPWSTEATKKEDFEYIRDLIRSTLSSEEFSNVARLGILSKDAHLIQLLLKYQSGTEIAGETKLNGNVIHQGYIIVSNPNI
jgi:hypothetical protein